MNNLENLKNLICTELENFIVKDTYTKGKNAGLRKALVLIEDITNENKTCKIINGQFSWMLEVDGELVSFNGGHNADYFEKHYKGLGYNVERINNQEGVWK